MQNTTTAVLTALLLLGLGAEPAAADSLIATRSQPLREVAHGVDIRLKNGVAIFRVRRTFANAGKLHEEARLTISLPFGAAATGLRIRGKKKWFDGELMERNKAAALYRKLTGIGPHEPRDPALLSWNWANELQLNVFPVPPGKKATVEYTLTVPTRYSRGHYTLSYPRHNGAKNLAVPILRVHPRGKNRTRITVNGKRTARAQSVALRQAVVKPLPGQLERSPGASHVVSTLHIRRRGFVQTVKVRVDIRHTYKSDLKIQLVTPSGESAVLHQKTGGSGNDIRKTYTVKLDEKSPVAGRWHLIVSDHAGRDVGQLVAWSVQGKVGTRRFRARAYGLPLILPDAPTSAGDLSQALVRLTPPRIRTLAGRLGRVVASGKKQFLRMELDTAPQLRPLPRYASVVFVVDASISMQESGVNEQLALARAYLAHVPTARFEVVLYRRFAKRLVGSFARASTFRAQVATARKRGLLDTGNGSALDEGLALAAKILRRRRGPLRIVMLSDNLLRPSWKNKRALRALATAPRSTIAHVVLPKFAGDEDEETTERRDDKHRLSPLAAKHGGVLLHIAGPETPSHKALKSIVLGLVRPIRIDHVRVIGLPHNHGMDLPKTLKEGDGLREMKRLATAPTQVTVVGRIWAAPYRKIIRVDKRFTRATAAFVFSHDLHSGLTNAEMMRVAKLGRVVSPVTSYLAIEPGVRPSWAGLGLDGLGLGGGGAGGGGSGSGGRGFGGWGGFKYPTLHDLMRHHIKRCVARHKPTANWQVRLRFHTTYKEVVDVVPRSPKSALQKCLVEGAWQILLPGNFTKMRDLKDITLP
jgi:subtilisin-like proprotein convertase family protein